MLKRIVITLMMVWCMAAIAVPKVMADESDKQLKEVVVTATKTERDPKDITQSVTVITGDEIKKSGATTAAEAIKRTVGVEINDYGSAGSTSTINIRGANYEQVLVLLDGRRLNSASAGGFDMADLPVPIEDIERIEIVRGPSSALYGADAVGGVINIITKKPTGLSTTVSAQGGRNGYRSLMLDNSNKVGKLSYTLSAGGKKYDGYRANSDLDQGTAGIKIGYDFSADSNLEFSTDYLGKEIGVPGPLLYPSPMARQWDRSLGTDLAYKARFSPQIDVKIDAYQNRDRIMYINPDPLFPQNSKHISTTSGASAQTTWLASSAHLLTIGAETRQDHLSSTDAGVHTTSLRAGYLQDEISLGQSLIIVVGDRFDSHSVYGDKASPKASTRYLVTGTGTIIRASAGEAFRAPTLNELFWTFDGFEQGNPNLLPETSKEYEAGIEQPFGKGNSIKVTYFKRKVANLIQWVSDPITFVYSPDNIGKARISGTETEARFKPFKWLTWTINYTAMDPVNETTGERIYGTIPSGQLKNEINFALPMNINFDLEGRWVKNYVKPGEPSWHYTVVDAKLNRTIAIGPGTKADITFGVKNAFNRQYQVVQGYPMPPAEVYGGVSLTF